jgi:hypothetical protein
MGEIYVRAEEVVIWLGEDNKGHARALFNYMIEKVPYRSFTTELETAFNETHSLKPRHSKDRVPNGMIIIPH